MTLCCFASENMTMSRLRLVNSFMLGQQSHTLWYDADSYDPEFYEKNKHILQQNRGAGYWLWKPYIIQKSLQQINDNEWLLYCDAGIEILSPIDSLTQLGRDIVLFHNRYPHMDWCKMDVLNAMLPKWNDRKKRQVQASVILVKNTVRARRFINEWLKWCQEPGFIDDSPSKLKNVNTFKEHRHDQAILCCLAIRDKIPTLSWYDYGNMFEHHRMRNNEYEKVV